MKNKPNLRFLRLALGFVATIALATAPPIVAAPLANRDFAIANPSAANFGWSVNGNVSVSGGRATLAEDGVVFPVTMSQVFTLRGGGPPMTIVIDAIDLSPNASGPGDAFEIALVNEETGAPVVGTAQAGSDAFFSIQQDGRLRYSALASIAGAGASGSVWSPTFPVAVTVDLSGVTADTEVLLSFDLLGFDSVASVVEIAGIALGTPPAAVDDSGHTVAEDGSVVIDVLANDTSADGALDPGTVLVLTGPAHGTTSVNATTGAVTYAPAANYSGNDSFIYRVADVNGNPSNASLVSIVVNPINDAPVLAGIEGAPLSYQSSAGPAIMTASLSVADIDDVNLVGAQIAITTNFAAGQDILAFAPQSGITGSYQAGAGILTLTGTASAANYQAALRSVTYQNSSGDPSQTTRTVTFTVNDGDANSVGAVRQIQVTKINVPPALTGIDATVLPYVENGSPVIIAPTIAIADTDDTALDGATIAIVANFAAANDVLGFVAQPGVSGDYNGVTGVLTITGHASLLAYQTLLRSVTYRNTSEAPSALTRTIHITVHDGDDDSTAVQRDVTVTPINDRPTLSGLEFTALEFTEDGAPIAITGAMAIQDLDDPLLTGATISISAKFAPGEDVLGFVDQNGISGSYNAATGVLTLSGAATVGSYQLALRSVTYENVSDHPALLTRTIRFEVNDGGALSLPAARNVKVNGINDPPNVTGMEAEVVDYIVNEGPRILTSSLVVQDVDHASLTGARVAVTAGFAAGQDVLAVTSGNGIAGSYDAGTGILTLTGTATAAAYQQALRSVTYANTSGSPSMVTRTVAVTVHDGIADSNVVTRDVTVSAANSRPVLGQIESSALVYLEDEGPTPASSTITITDANDATLASAVVALAANFVQGEDVLAFANQNGIAGSYNAASGVLNLTGSAAVADYETALRSVTYENTSDNPTPLPRTIRFVVNDGKNVSAPAARNISPIAVNDPPVLAAVESSPLNYSENSGAVAVSATIAVQDVDDTHLNGAEVFISSHFVAGQDVLNFMNQNGISGTYSAANGILSLSGAATVAAYETALRSITYEIAGENPSSLSRTISFSVNDGDAASNVAARTIDVTRQNDPPSFTSVPVLSATVEQLYRYSLAAADPDADTLTFAAPTRPAWLTLTDNGNGTGEVSGTPVATDVGANPVQLAVDDGHGKTAAQEFVITVAIGPDDYEVDDSAALANLISVESGDFQEHNFHDQGDEDWGVFHAEAQMVYGVRAFELGANADVVLEMYAADGTTLLRTVNAAGAGGEEQFQFDPNGDFSRPSGLFLLRVRNGNPAAFGTSTNYKLSVTRIGGSAPIGFLSGQFVDVNSNPVRGTLIVANGITVTITDGAYFVALAPGTYSLTGTTAGFQPESVAGVLVADATTTVVNIVFDQPLPRIQVDPVALTIAGEKGFDAAPATFSVANGGSGTLSYTIADNVDWLTVTPASGVSTGEADSITVNFATAGLSAGNYSAAITVTSADAVNSPRIVSVTLQVLEPPPLIVLNPRDFSFTVAQGANVPATSFSLRNGGGGTLSYTISDSANWLSVSPSNGSVTTESDPINVHFGTESLTPGGYNAVITVSSPSAANAPQKIDVTLIVLGQTIVRNGDFSAGFAEWVANPEILPAWWETGTPITADNALDAHVMRMGGPFAGTIAYQNLNVPHVADVTATVSVRVIAHPNTFPAEHALAFFLTYVDTADVEHRVEVLAPATSAVVANPVQTADYLFPATARKLIRFEVAKIGNGDFEVDDVAIVGAGLITGPVPRVAALSMPAGPYSSRLTITGANFGSTPGIVRIGGGISDGIANWTPNEITLTVLEPADSGSVVVIVDHVESNTDRQFAITSPRLSVDMLDNDLSAVKGQPARALIAVGFHLGFATAGGVDFTTTGDIAANLIDFTPTPVASTGGVLMTIDTATLAAGTYSGVVQATATQAGSRAVTSKALPFTLAVRTVAAIRFRQGAATITQLSVTQQGAFFVDYETELSDASVLAPFELPLAIVSNDPSVFIFTGQFGTEYYAQDNGQAILTATAPDGTASQLTVDVAISNAPKVLSVGLAPPMVLNTDDTTVVTFTATADAAISSIGYTGLLTINDIDVSFDPPFATKTFTLDTTNGPHRLGAFLWNADGQSFGNPRRVATLTIVNDPQTAMASAAVWSLDPAIPFFMLEHYAVEFYQNGNLSSRHEISNFSRDPTVLIGGVAPGDYQVKYVPDEFAGIKPQWYPNAASAASAGVVTMAAGSTTRLDFFARSQAEAPELELDAAHYNLTIDAGMNVAAQVFHLGNAGGGTLSYTISDDMDWLSAGPAAGTVSAGVSIPITVNFSTVNLTHGVYGGTITITGNGAVNSPRFISVQLTVQSVVPIIDVDAVAFTHVSATGTSPVADTFTVRNSGPGTLSFATSDNVDWLSISPPSGTSTGAADATIVTVNYATSNLPVGSHGATITIADPNAGNSPQTVAVTVTIEAAAGAPVFTSSPVVSAPELLAFEYAITTSDPQGDAVAITVSGALPKWLDVLDHGNGTGTLAGTPSANDIGEHFVTLVATDDGGLFATQSFTITVVGRTTFDVDGNGVTEVQYDGLLTIRYLFGFRGNALVASAVGTECGRCSVDAIAAFLADAGFDGMLDVDQNNVEDALTDGILILRWLAGSTGAPLITGAVAGNCGACDAAAIEAHLSQFAADPLP